MSPTSNENVGSPETPRVPMDDAKTRKANADGTENVVLTSSGRNRAIADVTVP